MVVKLERNILTNISSLHFLRQCAISIFFNPFWKTWSMSISVDLNITLINVTLPRVFASILLWGDVAVMACFIVGSHLYVQNFLFLWCFFSVSFLDLFFTVLQKNSRLDPGLLVFADQCFWTNKILIVLFSFNLIIILSIVLNEITYVKCLA